MQDCTAADSPPPLGRVRLSSPYQPKPCAVLPQALSLQRVKGLLPDHDRLVQSRSRVIDDLF